MSRLLSSIIICGVGGQGILLTSKVIFTAAQDLGLFVRTSDTIGMAQRGGSVSSHVRLDSRNVSPVIPSRCADALIAFELAEAVRMLPKLKTDAKAVINVESIVPTNATLKKGVYLKEKYLAALKNSLPNALFIEGTPLALKAGSVKALNMVILGAAAEAGALPLKEVDLREAIRECAKPELLEINELAFSLGVKCARR